MYNTSLAASLVQVKAAEFKNEAQMKKKNQQQTNVV